MMMVCGADDVVMCVVNNGKCVYVLLACSVACSVCVTVACTYFAFLVALFR